MPVPEPLRRQLSEGRALASEVAASAPGRRAFIIVRPEGGARSLEESLRTARYAGRIPVAHAFLVSHDEYDTEMLDTYDHDVGWTRHAEVRVATVDEVEAVLAAWGFASGALRPYWETSAP